MRLDGTIRPRLIWREGHGGLGLPLLCVFEMEDWSLFGDWTKGLIEIEVPGNEFVVLPAKKWERGIRVD